MGNPPKDLPNPMTLEKFILFIQEKRSNAVWLILSNVVFPISK